jgi:SPP1 gp7 family putative phage head morphogenesis protein
MAWYNFAKTNNATTSVFKPLAYAKQTISDLKEQFKGKELQEKVKFPADLGLEHPFEYKATEEVYKKVPAVMGAIDKYVDFIVGPGFYVKSKDEKAQTIIENFIRDFNFDSLLREWVKEALIKGNGYLELGGKKGGIIDGLKILDSKYIYIDSDDKGNILKFNQYFKTDFKQLKTEEIISLEPFRIAHIAFNKIGDCPYGYGLISSALITINNLLQNQKDLHTLMNRKANAPMHVKVGDLDRNLLPTEQDINTIGAKLEYMNNKHEWATDPTWDIKVVDFGDIGEKFSFVLEYDIKMLLFGLQVPEVLMGTGNIPEGLAKVQMDAWERNIQSKQAEIEKVIENDIFKRVLNAQGIDVHVEFEWGQQSNDEKATDIRLTTELLRLPILNSGLRRELETHIANTYGIDENNMTSEEEERAREEEQEQPVVPQPQEKTIHIHETYTDETIDNFKDMELSIKEWVGFNYDEFVEAIITELQNEQFVFLKANSATELLAGKFSESQVDDLRRVLSDGFREGKSIRQIANDVRDNTSLKPLYRIKNNKIILDDKGRPVIKATIEQRAIMIARTETVRAAARGQIANYKDNNIAKVRWVAAFSDRTCPICASLNGEIFDINNPTLPPAHVACRCATIPVVE